MTRPKHNHVSDESGDRKYYVQTPMLIWALVSDPYDLVLWFTIKSIAWENGVCRLSTEDLATLGMMSVGKVSECRQRLIELGLIEGEVKKEANYPQPVWHLTIPDVWEENIAWAKAHSSPDQKIAHKTLQRNKKAKERAAVKSLRQAKAAREKPSPGEGGTPPGEEGTPPGEEGTPPGEEGTPPGEEGTPPGEGSLYYKIYEDLIEDKNQDQIENLHVDPPSIPSSIARDQQSNGNGMDGFHPIPDPPNFTQKPMPTNGNGDHPSAASQSQRTQPVTPSAPLSEAPPVAAPLRTLALALIDEQLPEWRNPARHVDSRDVRDLHNLLTWLWLIKRLAEVAQLNPHSPEGYWGAVDTAPYTAALDGITDQVGYIVSRTGGGKELRSEAAPLIPADLEALTEAIEQYTESEVTP